MTDNPIQVVKPELLDILSRFLAAFPKKWFNTKSIQGWGSQQAGFEELKSMPFTDVRAALRELVTKKKAHSKKSEKGNWSLYSFSNK